MAESDERRYLEALERILPLAETPGAGGGRMDSSGQRIPQGSGHAGPAPGPS